MKFALVNGQRTEPQPDLAGECPHCNAPMVARCGDINVWHWGHRSKRNCDTWWENETAWHRAWKARFPTDWQEVRHLAPDGELHIADVKTEQGWVLEFQHSHLDAQERSARNAFYPKLVWVVDGQRRKLDQRRFMAAIQNARPLSPQHLFLKLGFHECRLIQEWGLTGVPVMVDFGEAERIWWVLSSEQSVYVSAFSRAGFVDLHLGLSKESAVDFEAFLKDFSGLVSRLNPRPQAQVMTPPPPQPQQVPSRLSQFDRQQMAREVSARSPRRFRF